MRKTSGNTEEWSTALKRALRQVCRALARKIVSDGEGVTHVVNIRVSGAASHLDADRAARWVGSSVLVKTSWFGGDPNWGRIVDALGYSPARIVEERIDVGYSAPGSNDITWSLRRGLPTPASGCAPQSRPSGAATDSRRAPDRVCADGCGPGSCPWDRSRTQ